MGANQQPTDGRNGFAEDPGVHMAMRVLPMRAPDGQTQWTIVELQGSLDGKEFSLDNLHLGDLFERRVSLQLETTRIPRLQSRPGDYQPKKCASVL